MVPRLLKVIFIDYLAKILRTELSSSLKTREIKKKNSLRNSLLKNSLLIATNDLTSRKFKYQSALMSSHGHLAASQEKRSHTSKPMPSLALNEHTSSSTSANSLYQYSSTQENAFKTYSLNLSKENTATCIQNDDSYIQYIDNDDSIIENLCDFEEKKNSKKSVNFDQIVLKADLKQLHNGAAALPTNPHIHCMCECSNNSISLYDNNQSSVGNGNFAVNKRRKYSVPVNPPNHEEPEGIKKLDKHLKNCLMNVMRKKSAPREPSASARGDGSHLIGKEFTMELKGLLESQFDPLIKSLLATIDKSEKRLQEKEKLEQIQNDWGDVAKVADHFLCFFFPTITIATCFVIFFNSPHVFSGW